MHVLICGGGVIGASIAYFLSCRGVKATVIEGTGLAWAASGKSGGFLARDWCDGSPLRSSFFRSGSSSSKVARNHCSAPSRGKSVARFFNQGKDRR
jgi:glycine/D-amino acid oxidase-like deaminating enzyme